MKLKLFVIPILAVLLFSNCKKEEDFSARDRELIVNYLSDNGLTAEEHDSGLFYIITDQGTGGHPPADANISIKYKGYLLDGTVFDQTASNQTATFNLQTLIQGWQIGIPLMNKGGSAMFFIPSHLGYGSKESGSIPANSVLIFEIDLIQF